MKTQTQIQEKPKYISCNGDDFINSQNRIIRNYIKVEDVENSTSFYSRKYTCKECGKTYGGKEYQTAKNAGVSVSAMVRHMEKIHGVRESNQYTIFHIIFGVYKITENGEA
jgi:UDP-glucose 4-epimerase